MSYYTTDYEEILSTVFGFGHKKRNTNNKTFTLTMDSFRDSGRRRLLRTTANRLRHREEKVRVPREVVRNIFQRSFDPISNLEK